MSIEPPTNSQRQFESLDYSEAPDFPKPIKSPKKKRTSKIVGVLLLIAVIIILGVVAKAYSLTSKVFVEKTSFWKKLQGIMTSSSNVSLIGEAQGRINILLLGYGGAGHDGPYLTDSMILASIQPQNKIITLYSIPRDYYWPTSSGNKINTAYAEGVKDGKDPLGGGMEAESAVQQLTGQSVPYFASLDFQGFQDAIDEVGGVDINVPDTFTDYLFPNDATNGYLPPLTFTAGEQHMDGTRALEFARSRHAAGIEGSDFARSRRQQLVIEAFKAKLQQLDVSKNPITASTLINTLAEHFNTNLEPDEALHLQQMFTSGSFQIITKNLDISTNLICNAVLPSDGEDILQPCDGVTGSQIKQFFAIDNSQSPAMQAALAAAQTEQASVIIENADPSDAATTALYSGLKQELTEAGITFFEVTYHGQPISQSVLYEVNKKPATESYIESYLGNGLTALPLPSTLKAKADLVVFVQSSSPSANQ
jgi:LCP family protein required for cell wall assembly